MVFLIGFLIHLRHMHHTVSSICTMFLSRFQTRCKHPIYSYQNVRARLSFSYLFLLYPLVITLQDWSVNHVRNLKCQPCMEAAQLRLLLLLNTTKSPLEALAGLIAIATGSLSTYSWRFNRDTLAMLIGSFFYP